MEKLFKHSIIEEKCNKLFFNCNKLFYLVSGESRSICYSPCAKVINRRGKTRGK